MNKPASEDSANAEIVAHALHVGVPALVAENSIARHHGEIGQLRETIDQVFSDAVGQILGLRIGARVDQFDRQLPVRDYQHSDHQNTFLRPSPLADFNAETPRR